MVISGDSYSVFLGTSSHHDHLFSSCLCPAGDKLSGGFNDIGSDLFLQLGGRYTGFYVILL